MQPSLLSISRRYSWVGVAYVVIHLLCLTHNCFSQSLSQVITFACHVLMMVGPPLISPCTICIYIQPYPFLQGILWPNLIRRPLKQYRRLFIELREDSSFRKKRALSENAVYSLGTMWNWLFLLPLCSQKSSVLWEAGSSTLWGLMISNTCWSGVVFFAIKHGLFLPLLEGSFPDGGQQAARSSHDWSSPMWHFIKLK